MNHPTYIIGNNRATGANDRPGKDERKNQFPVDLFIKILLLLACGVK